MTVPKPAAEPIRCPGCGKRMGFWKSNCLHCGAEIPLPADTPVPDSKFSSRLTSLGVLFAVAAALAAGGYASLRLPRDAFTVPAQTSPLLTPLARPATTASRAASVRPRPAGPIRLSTLDLHAAGWQAVHAGNLASAISYYQTAIERTPEDALAHNNLGLLLLETSDPARALAPFERAVALRPREAAFRANLGRARGRLEDWDGAAQACAQAVALDASNVWFRHSLAVAQLKRGRPAEAEASFRLVTAGAPDEAEGWYGLGLSLERLGRRGEAAEAYLRSVDLNGAATDASGIREHAMALRRGLQK